MYDPVLCGEKGQQGIMNLDDGFLVKVGLDDKSYAIFPFFFLMLNNEKYIFYLLTLKKSLVNF